MRPRLRKQGEKCSHSSGPLLTKYKWRNTWLCSFIPNPYYMCSHCSKLRNYITKLQQDVEQLKCQVVNLKEEHKRIQSKRFTIKDIEHSDHLVQLYNGLQNPKVFELLADNLRDKAVRLHYVRGLESNTPKAYQLGENRKKSGPERKSSVEEEFFMTQTRTLRARPCIPNESVPMNS